MKKVAVLGSGVVAQTLAKGFKKHGYEVRLGNRTADKLAAFSKENGIPVASLSVASAWADGIVLAVSGRAAQDVLQQAGANNIAGKTVIDPTNPIAEGAPDDGVIRYFTGPNDSLMERLQKAFPDAHFVKAFNSIGNAWMVNPTFKDAKGSMFYCGNDAGAKADVKKIIEQFGWEPCDMGKAAGARAIEPLCQLWCIPGMLGGPWNHAFRFMTV